MSKNGGGKRGETAIAPHVSIRQLNHHYAGARLVLPLSDIDLDIHRASSFPSSA